MTDSMEHSTLSRFAPVDPELEAKQWAAWRASRRRLLKAGLVAAGGMALAGVAGSAGPLLGTAAAQDGEPKAGGKIAMSLADDDVQSFDPIVPTDNMSIWTMVLIYDQLIRNGADGKSLEPGLAESWQRSDDGLVYTFKLRAAKFHDGTDLTADDVVYSLTRAVTGNNSQWGFIFSAVDKMEATDPTTVTIHLKQVWAPFEADLALFAASIISKKAHEAQGDDLFQKPIGTGPFVFDSWEKGSRIVLKKNPNFWDTGKPYLDELEFTVLTDANARMLQFQGGDLDIATDVPFSQLDSLRNNPDVTLLQDAVARFDYFGINVTKAPFDDKKLRQAMNYAINKDEIITNVLFGAGKPANTYLPLMAEHDDSAPGYPFDLEKAKQLVSESAGKDGFSAEILTDPGDPVGNQVAQLVASYLAQIGGKITVTQLEPGIRRQRVQKDMNYDLAKSYYTTDIIDPDELTTFAVQSDGGASAVWTGYKNADVDKMVKDAEAETDPAKRTELYKKIQAQHADDAPMLFLYYPTGRTVTQGFVKNFHILPTGNYRLWETWRAD